MPDIYQDAREEELVYAMAETITAMAILAHGRGLTWTRDALCDALRTLRDETQGPRVAVWR